MLGKILSCIKYVNLDHNVARKGSSVLIALSNDELDWTFACTVCTALFNFCFLLCIFHFFILSFPFSNFSSVLLSPFYQQYIFLHCTIVCLKQLLITGKILKNHCNAHPSMKQFCFSIFNYFHKNYTTCQNDSFNSN